MPSSAVDGLRGKVAEGGNVSLCGVFAVLLDQPVDVTGWAVVPSFGRLCGRLDIVVGLDMIRLQVLLDGVRRCRVWVEGKVVGAALPALSLTVVVADRELSQVGVDVLFVIEGLRSLG